MKVLEAFNQSTSFKKKKEFIDKIGSYLNFPNKDTKFIKSILDGILSGVDTSGAILSKEVVNNASYPNKKYISVEYKLILKDYPEDDSNLIKSIKSIISKDKLFVKDLENGYRLEYTIHDEYSFCVKFYPESEVVELELIQWED